MLTSVQHYWKRHCNLGRNSPERAQTVSEDNQKIKKNRAYRLTTVTTSLATREMQSRLHLLISCELHGGFGGNFQNIHPVAPPQRLHSTFFHHILPTPQHVPLKLLEPVDLMFRIKTGTRSVKQRSVTEGSTFHSINPTDLSEDFDSL